MKSTAKKKLFINNMITLGMVVAAWIIMEVLMGTGHVSSLLKGLLVPFCIYVIMAVSLNLTVGILGELSLGHAGFMCVGGKYGFHGQPLFCIKEKTAAGFLYTGRSDGKETGLCSGCVRQSDPSDI